MNPFVVECGSQDSRRFKSSLTPYKLHENCFLSLFVAQFLLFPRPTCAKKPPMGKPSTKACEASLFESLSKSYSALSKLSNLLGNLRE